MKAREGTESGTAWTEHEYCHSQNSEVHSTHSTHAAHASHAAAHATARAALRRRRGRALLLDNHRLGGDHQRGDRGGVRQRRAHDLERVDDARAKHVLNSRVRVCEQVYKRRV
jgi:hypothetical protein